MPLANAGTTDALLKLLEIELYQAADASELRSWNWTTFRRIDHPKTTDPVELATAAFLYLSIDDAGAWRKNRAVLEAVLSFLQLRRQASPSPEHLDDIIDTLEFPQVTIKDVRDWFIEVFPSLPP